MNTIVAVSLLGFLSVLMPIFSGPGTHDDSADRVAWIEHGSLYWTYGETLHVSEGENVDCARDDDPDTDRETFEAYAPYVPVFRDADGYDAFWRAWRESGSDGIPVDLGTHLLVSKRSHVCHEPSTNDLVVDKETGEETNVCLTGLVGLLGLKYAPGSDKLLDLPQFVSIDRDSIVFRKWRLNDPSDARDIAFCKDGITVDPFDSRESFEQIAAPGEEVRIRLSDL